MNWRHTTYGSPESSELEKLRAENEALIKQRDEYKQDLHHCQVDCNIGLSRRDEYIARLRAENEALLLIKDAAEDCLDKALDWVNSTDKEENETRELSPEFQRLKDLLICEEP